MAGLDFQTNVIIGGRINPNLKRAMDTAGRLVQKTSDVVTKTNRRMATNTESLRKSMAGALSVTKKVALAGAVVGGAAVLGGKAMLDQAASMEQYRSTLNIAMKDQQKAAETFRWAVDFANKTPFETDEIVQATVKLQTYGLEAQKILPLVGDMAAAMGKGIDQAVEAIADAQTGELERLKEFGITKEQIVEHANKVLAGIEVVNQKGQITNQKAFNLALLSLMKERYKGGTEILAGSYRGLMSTVTGVWKSGLAEMAGITPTGEIAAGSFFDIIKRKAGELADRLSKMQADGTFQRLQKDIGGLTARAADGLDRLLPKAVELVQYVTANGPRIISIALWLGKAFLAWKVISGVNAVVQTMFQLGDAISLLRSKYIPLLALKAKDGLETLYLQGLYAKDAVVMAGRTAATWAMTAAQKAYNLAAAAGAVAGKALGAAIGFLTSPIGLVILGITALVAAVYYLWRNWDTVSKAVVGVWQTYVLPFFQGVAAWFSNLFAGISETFRGFINWVIGGINGLIGRLNSLNFRVPDWVPGVGGKTFGINIPTIPTFARGGITNRPAIFGEAGPEVAIPLKPKSPRSISLLDQTAKILGVGPAGAGNVTVIYSPNIYGGGNVPEIKAALQDDFERFKAYFEQLLHDQGRLSFSGQVL